MVLARNLNGDLFVIGNICETSLAQIELGEGPNGDARKWDSTILAPDAVSGWFQVRLDPLSAGYTLEEGSADPAALTPPLFVRFWLADSPPGQGSGYYGHQVFDRLPQNGMAMFMPEGGAAGLQEVPISEVPTSLTGQCPATERSFEIGSE